METEVLQHQDLRLKSACVQFMFAYQQKDVDKMLSFCNTEGEVFFEPLGETGRGKIGQLGKEIWSTLIDCFPDIDNTVDASISENKGSVRCQVVIKGTQAKDFADIPNKGLHFESDHIFIFHLDHDQKIDNLKVIWDHDDFKKQLGS